MALAPLDSPCMELGKQSGATKRRLATTRGTHDSEHTDIASVGDARPKVAEKPSRKRLASEEQPSYDIETLIRICSRASQPSGPSEFHPA